MQRLSMLWSTEYGSYTLLTTIVLHFEAALQDVRLGEMCSLVLQRLRMALLEARWHVDTKQFLN